MSASANPLSPRDSANPLSPRDSANPLSVRDSANPVSPRDSTNPLSLRDSTLPRLLDVLAPIAGPARAGEVEDLRRRWSDARLRVLLVGEAKRGKSTLGNALLGRAVLPTGVTPVTAIATEVVPVEGDEEWVDVVGQDGTSTSAPLDRLADLVTEQGNPANVRRVAHVRVHARTALGDLGVVLVDTPGVGSALAHNTEAADEAYRRMDAALFVLTADPPASASELELLDRVRAASVRTFVVLNKVDRLDPQERAEAAGYVRQLVGENHVFECSARQALAAERSGTSCGADGFANLSSAVHAYLRDRAATDLEASLRAAACRIAESALDDALVEGAVLAADDEAARTAVAAFRGRIGALDVRAQEAAGRVAWVLSTLRREVDASAHEQVRSLAARGRAVVEDELERIGSERVDDIDRLVRDALRDVVGHAVHEWQAERLSLVHERLETVATRESSALDEACRDIRDAASRLLRVELSRREIPLQAPSTRRVVLDFSEDVGWRPPLTGIARRTLPTAVARRRLARELLAEAPRLADKHVGRARSAVQAELDRLARAYATTMATAYADAGARFRALVDDATRSAHSQEISVTERRATVDDRRRALVGVLERLRPSAG
ncbi:hypothetical protein BN12_430002 [Nostocoides japonicum T1-X7]|uniref:Dynamin N-terminal domain-containing protein n=1 Tax=Nostocoides japonicum T1-X7 TaxID=1194083 RepID=A0A077M2U6_9MICO|nr:dynamin family protein [Tetrasphaera japonica]CCH79412.1 hypothetical protein BN12_430002 [Tetrasphaera japonica T1-X7]